MRMIVSKPGIPAGYTSGGTVSLTNDIETALCDLIPFKKSKNAVPGTGTAFC